MSERVLLSDGSMRPGEPVQTALELVAEAVLEVRAESEGPGTLLVSAARVDAAGSRPRGAPLQREHHHAGGTLQVRLPLPAPAPDRYAVELLWQGDAAASLTELVVHEAAAPSGTPIIWINVDTFAARHSNLFGYARETTPNLAALADEAIIFERCRANAPWTLPSTMSQLTGLLPLALRIPDDVQLEDADQRPLQDARWQLPRARWTAAEMLSAAGYSTAAFLDNPYLSPGYGFAQGFETWDMESADIHRIDPSGGLAHMESRMLAWLDGLEPEQPFFLFLQPFDPHGPYVPAPANAALFLGDGLTADLGTAPVSPVGSQRGTVNGTIAKHRPGAQAGDEVPDRVELGPLVDAYDRSIRTFDDALGSFLVELRARGVLERAVLVISADHGESTVRHESFFEHAEPWEDVLHVPLLIRMPNGVGGGRRITTNVQGVDIYPTLAEIAGLAHERPHLDGRSLLPALRGETLPPLDSISIGEQHDTLVVIRDEWKLYYRRPRPGDPAALQSLREVRRWREQALDLERNEPLTVAELHARIAEHPEREALLASWRELRSSVLEPRAFLFDLSTDPSESQDRSDDHPDLLDSMLRAGLELEARAQAAQEDAPTSGEAYTPDAELLETLHGLGYGGGR